MKKIPFNPNGVAAMCRPFYELNEAARLAAAHELGNNLPLWFNKTFEPSERRASYFNAIKPQGSGHVPTILRA